MCYSYSTMIDFTLDKNSPVPFYRQIADRVLAGLSSGALRPGDRLPTIREMAVNLEVNPNTVVRAYSHLEMLGVLDSQQGSGVYVRPQAPGAVSAVDRERRIDDLCRDFVGRAQLAGVDLDELVERLRRMRI